MGWTVAVAINKIITKLPNANELECTIQQVTDRPLTGSPTFLSALRGRASLRTHRRSRQPNIERVVRIFKKVHPRQCIKHGQ